jgi:hypothetical protein
MELCKVNFRYQGICWYQNGSLAKVQIQFPYIRSQKKKEKKAAELEIGGQAIQFVITVGQWI